MLTDMMCPPIWDYVMCWNATEAGTTVVQPCPNYIHKFLLNGKIISHLSTKYFTILLNTIKWMLYLSFDRCNDLVNIYYLKLKSFKAFGLHNNVLLHLYYSSLRFVPSLWVHDTSCGMKNISIEMRLISYSLFVTIKYAFFFHKTCETICWRLLQQTDNNQCILNTTLGNLMLVSKTILRNYISFKHFVMRGLDSTWNSLIQ